MNPIDGQLLLALACVAVAAAVLVRRFIVMIKDPESGGCGSGNCSGCPSKSAKIADGFVSLDILSRSDDAKRGPDVVRAQSIEKQ